jgi:hypothetical protein
MRQRWLRSLALSLGVLVMGQGAFLRADPPAPLIEPYPPVEMAPKSPAPPGNDSQRLESTDSAPAASLQRPIPLDEERPIVDRKIQPTGLFTNSGGNSFVFGPAGSYPAAQPTPVGPNAGSAPLPMPAPVLTTPQTADVPYSWRQPATSAPASQGALLAPTPSMLSTSPGTSFGTAATPLPPGTVVSPGVVATPGVVTGPMGAPLVDGGCAGNDCCAPGCGTPGCCPPDCCMPNGCAPGCCPGLCCDGCCGWGNGCCFGNRWYGSAEYLLWFIRGDSLPPLLTTGPINASVPGALGQPGTAILYGNNSYQNNPYSGVRLRGGYWFGDCHGLGLDVGGFILGGNSRNFTASSMGSPILTRPFFNALTGLQDTELVAGPGLAGTFSAVNTFFLYGAEANLRRNFLCGCNWFIDGFAGWRLLGLNESLSMTENLAAVSSTNPGLLPAGSTFSVNDRFATSNLFNGGQIGAIGEYRLGRWSVDLRTSVGVGGTMQFVNVSGSTTSAAPGVLPTTSPGGLLALSSNIGPHTRSMVSFIEEVGINLGYQFTNHIRGFVGYNFLFWSNVVRPGQQIDLNVNPNLLPPVVAGGPNRPAFSFNGSNFWVQGIQFGIDIRW